MKKRKILFHSILFFLICIMLAAPVYIWIFYYFDYKYNWAVGLSILAVIYIISKRINHMYTKLIFRRYY